MNANLAIATIKDILNIGEEQFGGPSEILSTIAKVVDSVEAN